jgi:hypothetical protein
MTAAGAFSRTEDTCHHKYELEYAEKSTRRMTSAFIIKILCGAFF